MCIKWNFLYNLCICYHFFANYPPQLALRELNKQQWRRRLRKRHWKKMNSRCLTDFIALIPSCFVKCWQFFWSWIPNYCIKVQEKKKKVVLRSRPGQNVLLGTLRSDHGDGNGNATKAIGLISKTTILHVLHFFFYISLPSLHDYDVKLPNFTFYRGSTQATTKFPLSFWTWIWSLGI